MTGPHAGTARPGPFRLALAAAALGAAAVAAAGCQTMTPGKGAAKPSDPAAASAYGAGAASASSPNGGDAQKTEFRRDVGPEQEFNVHVELARALESQESHEAAVLEYQKAVAVCERKGSAFAHSKLGPDKHAMAERRTGAAYDRLGRFAQAEAHYLKALKLAPRDAKVWNDAGYSYYVQNRLADAQRALKTADSLDPNNPRVLTNLGLAYAAQGKDDEALAALSRAGGPAVGHANLGYILAAMGKTDRARQQYRAAVELQPGLAAARQALAKLDADADAATGPALAAAGAAPAAPGTTDAGLTKTSAAPAAPAVNPAALVPRAVK